MGGKIGLIAIFLVFTSLILRKWLVGAEKAELSDRGKKVRVWGSIIIALIAFTIIILGDLEGNALKWFLMLLIITNAGFQSFIDWKYLKGSKEYIVSLIVLLIGVALVYFIF
ncbi:DUF4181 domain-containing protein [Bacillus sp. FJAT-28004]|uniref:DUF4181 domain-containing protein n=1 Tax=Bacillus sp. FJAT-28004 TaxID=1679165 RepID=UPI0006B4BA60|nr:DUF4181 domain-containing protein [Bacillus sp. FJAT-28004]